MSHFEDDAKRGHTHPKVKYLGQQNAMRFEGQFRRTEKTMISQAVTLDDKYALAEGRVFVTGTQALVRLPIVQRWRDKTAGLDTAGYVTGYRGSPLGGMDQAFIAAKKFTDAADIRFQPGLNEDLAATAVQGTQQIGLFGDAVKDGVFATWYAKGRGTVFDPFGRSHDRRVERELIDLYRKSVEHLLTGLTPEQYATAIQIAELPIDIKGYGPVKDRSLAQVRARWSDPTAEFDQTAQRLRLIAAE